MNESELLEMLKAARHAARRLAAEGSRVRDAALEALATGLLAAKDEVLAANAVDVARAEAAGQTGPLLDRLRLTAQRVGEMASGVRDIRQLPDPIGEVARGWTRPNGLQIQEVRVPLGVVAVIYESRPNVTIDVAALCLKSGNASILKGGSDALQSNQVLVGVIHRALDSVGLDARACQLINTPDRQMVRLLLQQEEWIDVVIPRGGEGLIREVVQNSRIPVIRQYKGVCHVYVAADADLSRSIEVIVNAKCQRPATCNALETLLVDEQIAGEFLPALAARLEREKVELRGCQRTCELLPQAKHATAEDWDTEYLDLILSVRIVAGLDMAIEHIHQHGSGHSEAIMTESLALARRFQLEVDAACVYVNASTRFTDGGQFGFGAEVGISTGKLHSRGPMGVRDLTTRKFLASGDYLLRS